MNKYEQYKKTLDDKIDSILINNYIDINSIDELNKLMDMSKKIQKCLKEYSDEEYENKTDADKENYSIKEYFNKYLDYKEKFKQNSEYTEYKEQMIICLDKMLDCLFKMFEEISVKSVDYQESQLIKEFLQKTYRMF